MAPIIKFMRLTQNPNFIFTPPLIGIFSHKNGIASSNHGKEVIVTPLLDQFFENPDFWVSLI